MDKYEYRVKTEQMLEYMEKKLYRQAMEIADTIDWRRVKSSSMLSTVSEIYECNGENQKSRDILFIAYDRSPGSRKIVYRLGILAVKIDDLQEAMDCYDEFVAMAPKDPNQFILKYKILKAQNAPKEQQIEALVDFKKVEYVEKWAYELAKLYHEAGMITECLEECDDLILWFSEGKYVLQAMKLKMRHKPLTPLQQEKYNHCVMEQTKSQFKKPEKKEQPEAAQEKLKENADVAHEIDIVKDVKEEQPEKEVEESGAEQRESSIKQTIVGATLAEALAKGVAAVKGVIEAAKEEIPVEEESEAEVEEEIPVEEESEAEVEEETPAEEKPEAEVEEETPTEEEPEAEVEEETPAEEEPEAEVEEETPAEEEPEAEVEEETPAEEEPEAETEEETLSAQEKIEGILQSWEEKQREVEKQIEEKRLQAEAERAEREARRKEMAEQNMFNPAPIIPDDIQKLLEDLENGILDGDEDIEEARQPIVNTQPEEEIAVEEESEEEAEFEDVTEEDFDFEDEEEFEEENPLESYDFEDEEDFEEEFELEEESQEASVYEAPVYEAPIYETPVYEAPVYETPVYTAPAYTAAPEFAEEEYSIEEDDDIIEQEFEIPLQEEEPAAEEPIEEEPKTALERLEEQIAAESRKSPGGVPFDTGFVVQGRYDLEAQSEIGLKAGLTEEQKKLFSYFVPVRGMSEQIVEVLENDKNCRTRYGTSRTGNVLVVGRPGTGKTVLAVNVVKAIQRARQLKQGKVAIVTGEALNKKDLPSVLAKMKGGAIIIEKAGMMNERTIRELNDLMEEQTGEMLVVLEEQRKPLERLLAVNSNFKRKFTSKLELPIFINDELVTFGQTYAKENGYKIDEMGILALYSRIDVQQKEDHAVTVTEVKDIIDEAIERAQTANVKHFMKRIFGKHTDNADRVILTEQDFK